MELGLQQKTIVVSGGATGIGAAIARACLQEGANVVIVNRPSAEMAAWQQEAEERGAACACFAAELEDVSTCAEAIAFTVQRFGGVYGLVNNAGINDSLGLEHGSVELFERSLRRNLLHYYALAHAAVPHLKQERGTILNISSKVALTGQGGTSGYAAAKGAQLSLTREWAAELASAGVRVNALLPAEVLTPHYRQWLSQFPDPEQRMQQIEQRIPLGQRMTSEAEVAAAAVFLLSPIASAHTTGQHVVVDGGYIHLDRALS